MEMAEEYTFTIPGQYKRTSTDKTGIRKDTFDIFEDINVMKFNGYLELTSIIEDNQRIIKSIK